MRITFVRSHLVYLSTLLFLSTNTQAQFFPSGQLIPPGQMAIDGIPVNCGPVSTVLAGPEINDLARAIPGQILINWPFFSQLPTGVKMFTYSHECGHQIYGFNENVADQFAIKLGKQQGWINIFILQQICQAVFFSPGDWTHMPGPARCQAMFIYFQSP